MNPYGPSSGASDYHYVPALRGSPPDTLVVVEIPAYHPGNRRAVLSADGTVRTVNPAELATELAKPQNAVMASELKALGVP